MAFNNFFPFWGNLAHCEAMRLFGYGTIGTWKLDQATQGIKKKQCWYIKS